MIERCRNEQFLIIKWTRFWEVLHFKKDASFLLSKQNGSAQPQLTGATWSHKQPGKNKIKQHWGGLCVTCHYSAPRHTTKGCTHPPCFKLCRFRGGGFDQRHNNGGFNSLLLRLLRRGQPKRCHWINTVPGSERKAETKRRRGWGNTTKYRRKEGVGRKRNTL